MALSKILPSRKTVAKTAGFFGGMYLAHAFLRDRLEEAKDKQERERLARESLKRRFDQTHHTTSYTVLALLPELSEQILSKMDVETLTRELQSRSRTRVVPPPTSPSLASSIEIIQTIPSDDVSTVSASIDSLNSSSSAAESVLSIASTSTSDSRSKAELWNEVKILTLTRTLTALYSITLLCLLTTIQLTILARQKYVHSILEQEQEERLREKIEAQMTLSNMLFQGLGLGGSGNLEALLNGFGGDEDDDDETQHTRDHAIDEETEHKYLTLSWWLLHVGCKDVGERVRRGVEEVFDGISLKTKMAGIDLHRLVSDVRRRVEHEVTFEGNEKKTSFLSSLLPSTPETIHHTLTQGGFTPPSTFHLNPDQLPGEPSGYTSTTLSSSQLSHSQYFALPANGIGITPYDQSPTDDEVDNDNDNDLIQIRDVRGKQASPYPHISSDAVFLSLIRETQGVIESPDFARVLEGCLDRATELLFSGLMKNVFVEPQQQQNGDAPSEEVRIRLAGLLPGLARWSQLALNGLPNELVDGLLAVYEVGCLSAIIFGKFEEAVV